MFDELYINDYCSFNTFKMNFAEKENNNVNLNLLVGKNGSGKSCLLDALFELGQCNLKNNIEKFDNTTFNYKLSNNNKIIATNMNIKNEEFYSDTEKQQYQWDAIIRFYTGHTKRQILTKQSNAISLSTKDTKWAFLAYVTSGLWHHKSDMDESLWLELQNIIFGKKKQIDPKIIWVDVRYSSIEENIDKKIFPEIREADNYSFIDKNTIRFFWNLNKEIKIEIEDHIQNKINPLPQLEIFLSRIDPLPISYKYMNNGMFINTGFLYTQGDSNKLYPDLFLSDGEHGFFTRFALLMILKEENINFDKNYLILLDEPETHFNENWKTFFLSLICKIFDKTNHDIFIATHSAMLVTDAKQNEIHRLENNKNGIMHYPVPINTYGANIVDIGKALFQMESDIGERSKNDIEGALKKGDRKELNDLLKQVGPGEWRWKIRAKLNQLDKADSCCNFKSKKEDSSNEKI